MMIGLQVPPENILLVCLFIFSLGLRHKDKSASPKKNFEFMQRYTRYTTLWIVKTSCKHQSSCLSTGTKRVGYRQEKRGSLTHSR